MGIPVSNEATDEKKQILVFAGSVAAPCVTDLDPIIWFLQQKIYIPVGRVEGPRSKHLGQRSLRDSPAGPTRIARPKKEATPVPGPGLLQIAFMRCFARVNMAYLPK
jgi:hypothetical protein